MAIAKTRLTILFEDPFWIGLCQREEAGCYTVCRIVFGAEPRDGEVYEFLLKGWNHLRFSPPLPADTAEERRISPKRLQRELRRQPPAGIGTKAQQALQLQREQAKQQRQARTREEREAEQRRQFALRQEKRREKHNGH